MPKTLKPRLPGRAVSHNGYYVNSHEKREFNIMKRENLMNRLGKRFLPYFLTGVLAFSTLFNYRCADEFVDPEPKKPVAMLTAEPTEGDAPLEVSFDGSMSYAREGHLEKYLWDFGDGETDSTSGAWVNHVYEEGGEYNASLVVVDNQGQESNKVSEKIVVTENVLGRIAFWSNYREGVDDDDIYSGDIVIRGNDIEFINISRLTTDPGQDITPVWSPDGNQIVFVSYREGDSALFIMNADGTNQRRLTNDMGWAGWPDWCSDGKIVFTYIDSGLTGIATINPDGTEFTKLVEQLAPSHPPHGARCSPDASKLAISAYSEWQNDIHIMNSDGTNQVNLTNHPSGDFSPSWSPDGNQIVFTSFQGCASDIFIMNADGSNVINLTNTSSALEGILDCTPAWSPDGEWIVYGAGGFRMCDEEGNMIYGEGMPVLHIMKSNGSNALCLDEYYGAYFAWKPNGYYVNSPPCKMTLRGKNKLLRRVEAKDPNARLPWVEKDS